VISAAITTIQVTLITPSANSAAISPTQQPTQDPPRLIPRRSPPPGRFAITSVSGLRHLSRHTALAVVNWFILAALQPPTG
jgi:hypothetical protein